MEIRSTLSSIALEDPVIIDRYKHLAAAIIKSAANDLRTLPINNPDRQSAVKFFRSKWFNYLADALDLEPSQFSKMAV